MGRIVLISSLLCLLAAGTGSAGPGIRTQGDQGLITFQAQTLGDPIGCIYAGGRFLCRLTPAEMKAGQVSAPLSELQQRIQGAGEVPVYVFIEGYRGGERIRADEGARFVRGDKGQEFVSRGEAVPDAGLVEFITKRYEALRQIRAQIVARHAQWTADVNPVFMLPDAERQQLLGVRIQPGLRPNPPDRRLQAIPVPDSLDWTKVNGKNYITGIRDQGSCGSCWAFGSVAQVEALVNVAENNTGIALNLAEQDLVSCCSNCGDCGGGDPWVALEYIMVQGIPLESCFPYQGQNSSCTPCTDWLAQARKINTMSGVTNESQDETAILNALATHPVSTCVYVDDSFASYVEGIYSYTGPETYDVNHSICIVGWGGGTSEPYLKIKNSWGLGWGEAGFMRARRGQGNELGWYTADATYLPLSVDAGKDTTIRAGDTLTLKPTVQNGAPCYDTSKPAYTYAWSPRTGLSDSTLKSPKAYPKVTTIYRLTAKDLNVSKKDSVKITVLPSGVAVAPAAELPPAFGLAQNRPNPFGARTAISYSLPAAGHVTIKVYDAAGRCLKTLVDQEAGAGAHTAWWDGTNAAGGKAGVGIYFYRMEFGSRTSLREVIRL